VAALVAGVAETRALLSLNGQAIEPSQADEVATLVAVAEGWLIEHDLAAWLERNSRLRSD
jgi:prophage maintenance system killer protein